MIIAVAGRQCDTTIAHFETILRRESQFCSFADFLLFTLSSATCLSALLTLAAVLVLIDSRHKIKLDFSVRDYSNHWQTAIALAMADDSAAAVLRAKQALYTKTRKNRNTAASAQSWAPDSKGRIGKKMVAKRKKILKLSTAVSAVAKAKLSRTGANNGTKPEDLKSDINAAVASTDDRTDTAHAASQLIATATVERTMQNTLPRVLPSSSALVSEGVVDKAQHDSQPRTGNIKESVDDRSSSRLGVHDNDCQEPNVIEVQGRASPQRQKEGVPPGPTPSEGVFRPARLRSVAAVRNVPCTADGDGQSSPLSHQAAALDEKNPATYQKAAVHE
eukprot:SAG31_NODE_7115_length_1785_cov_0.935350_1_plen_333_part_00